LDPSSELAAFAEVEEMVDIATLMQAPIPDRQSVVNINVSMVNLSKLKMPLMRTHLLTQRPLQSRVEHPDIRSTAVLRQVMVGNVLLGTPKALE
jgi:hypothetical protein